MTTRTRRTPAVPASRVVYYPDPTTDPYTELARYTAAELAARRRRDAQLYARWAARQAAIAEQDRRNRRSLLAALGVFALAVVAGLALTAWFAYRIVTAAADHVDSSWLGLAALGLLVLAGLAVGGHRCITIVEHRH
jgi:hypothetical protein